MYGVMKLITRKVHIDLIDKITKEPVISKNGDKIFGNSKTCLITGVLLTLLFSLCTIMMNYYVTQIIEEQHIAADMVWLVYVCGYFTSILFTLIGLKLLIIYFCHKIIISNDTITAKKLFSTRTIKITAIENVTYSELMGFTFKSRDTKISTGFFTIGLVWLTDFVYDNIQRDMREKALKIPATVLKANGIRSYY